MTTGTVGFVGLGAMGGPMAANLLRRGRRVQGFDLAKPALDALADGTCGAGDRELFRPMLDHLLNHDDYLLLADYRAYVEAQSSVEQAFADPARWTRMSILNSARAGRFSSDRAIREYCARIWNAARVPVELR